MSHKELTCFPVRLSVDMWLVVELETERLGCVYA